MAQVNTTTSSVGTTNTTAVNTVFTSQQYDSEDKYKQLKIISSVVVVGVFLLICAIAYFIYRRTCRGHKARKHGVELEEARAQGKGKREYYDPFGVDTAELTVNSVTAIIGDKDEKTPWNSAHRGSSSGVECDPPSCSDDNSVHNINTGKRVFQVNRVSEGASRPAASGQQVLVRLPKGLANAARSVQASNGTNFTLALVDKHSNTIHNIDLRNYRSRVRGKSPLASDAKSPPQRVLLVNGKRRRLHSCGDGATTSKYNHLMVHDSPDTVRKPRGMSMSADDIAQDSSGSLTDHSNTNSEDKGQDRSPSISSKETDEKEDSATHLLAHTMD